MTPTAEETACDDIAADWVRWHGDLALFRAEFDEIVRLFDFEHRRGTKRIDLLGIVDQWEETHGLAVEDFEDLRFEIEGWIVSHMSAYGMVTWPPISTKLSEALSTSASTLKPSQY